MKQRNIGKKLNENGILEKNVSITETTNENDLIESLKTVTNDSIDKLNVFFRRKL
jgi:hypothetical protein